MPSVLRTKPIPLPTTPTHPTRCPSAQALRGPELRANCLYILHGVRQAPVMLSTE